MYKFIVISRSTLEARGFKSSNEAATWLLGRNLNDFIVIKDENRIVTLVHADHREVIRGMEKT